MFTFACKCFILLEARGFCLDLVVLILSESGLVMKNTAFWVYNSIQYTIFPCHSNFNHRSYPISRAGAVALLQSASME